MKFRIENLGPVGNAEIELGDLTVVCGANNTGKTYLSYALGCLLGTVNHDIRMDIPDGIVGRLSQTGSVDIRISDFIDGYVGCVKGAVAEFTGMLPRFLAMRKERFARTKIGIGLRREDVERLAAGAGGAPVRASIGLTKNCRLLGMRDGGKSLRIQLENEADTLPDREVIRAGVSFLVTQAFVGISRPIFPDAFVITCERTGAALFRTELIMSRELSLAGGGRIAAREELDRRFGFRGYQLPVAKDLLFAVRLGDVVKRSSRLADEHPGIIRFFEGFAGGRYAFDADADRVMFIPSGTDVSLDLPESSSAVRSLMELNFYLKHKAARGQILMVDEPELNLHPGSQRRIARLFAMLVNAGIKVFITTHSDYFIREFSALIRLGRGGGRLDEIRESEGYRDGELLDAGRVRAYVAERRDGGVTLEPAPVSPDLGIQASTLDDVIDRMNQIQDAITWGGGGDE